MLVLILVDVASWCWYWLMLLGLLIFYIQGSKKVLSNWVTNIQQQVHWIPSLIMAWSLSHLLVNCYQAILQARCSMIFWSDTFIRISLKLPPEGRQDAIKQLAAETKGNQPESFTICIHVPMIIRIPYICHEIFYISYNIQDLNPTYKKYRNMGMIRTLPRSSVLRLGRSITQRMPSSWWGKLSARPPPKQIKNTSSFIMMCWRRNYITVPSREQTYHTWGNRKIIDSKGH